MMTQAQQPFDNSPRVELPIAALLHYFYRQLFWVMLVGSLFAILAVGHMILNHRYDVTMALRYDLAQSEKPLLMNIESELRVLQSRDSVQKLRDALYQPAWVEVPFSTRIDYVLSRLSGVTTPPPSLLLKSFQYNARPHAVLEVTYRGKNRFVVLDDRAKRFQGEVGRKLITPRFEMQIDAIGGAVGSVFMIKPISKQALFQRLERQFKVQAFNAQSGFSKRPSDVIEMHFSTHNPAWGIAALHVVRDMYQRALRQRLNDPLNVRKELLAKRLQAEIKEFTNYQNQSKNLLASYGITKFDSAANLAVRGLAELSDAIIEATNDKFIAQEQFTSEHPSILAITQRLKFLEEKRNQLQNQRARLPIQEAHYLVLEQKAQSVKKRMDVTAQALARMQLRMEQAENGIQMLAAPYAQVTLKKSTLLKRALVGAFLGVVLSIICLGLLFIYRYIRRHFYYMFASKLHLPILAELKIPGSFYVGKSADMVIKRLMRMQRAFSESSQNMRYLLEMPNANLLFISHLVGAKDAALIALSSAIYLARHHDKRVCLVDADLSHAHCSRYLRLQPKYGLADVLLKKASMDKALREIQAGKLDMIAASCVPMNAALLQHDKAFEDLLRQLRERYDYVIVNMPAVASWKDWYVASDIKPTVILHTLLGQKPDEWASHLMRLPASLRAKSLLLFSQRHNWLWRVLG
jgi:tyrosine-protein kinase Etk/Wzc